MLDNKIIEALKEYYKDITIYAVALILIDNKHYNEALLFSAYLESLVANGFIVRHADMSLIINPKIIEDDLDDKIEDYRKLWHYNSSGVKGKMGNKTNCKERFKAFLKEHNITADNLIELGTYYVSNFQQISGYLQQADYFLYKEKLINGKRITESRAANLLAEYGDFTVDDTLTI